MKDWITGFNDLGLGDMMGKNVGAPDASGMRREFDALVRSVGSKLLSAF